MIFRVSASHDHAVVGDGRQVVLMQIFISDHIIVDVLMLEPVEQVRVGVVPIDCRTVPAEP
jgi:hypothetical protein